MERGEVSWFGEGWKATRKEIGLQHVGFWGVGRREKGLLFFYFGNG
jgi:hypothetical protein